MLDVDKMADALLSGTRALISKEIAPLRAENERLAAENKDLCERVKAIEDAEQPAPQELPDINAMISSAIAAIPAPVIPDPIPGKDGLSIAEVKQNDDGELIVKMTNGETINAGMVRGAAGVGFDDLTVEHDGERGLSLRFQRDGVVKAFSFEIPALIDRGVWEPGAFAKGDAVTWGGSVWFAQEATAAKPGTDKTWRLAVKKGRDAKPAVKPEAE